MKPTISFIPDGNGENKKLRCRVSVNSKIVSTIIVAHVDTEKWSREQQRCKRGSIHTKKRVSTYDINSKIQYYEDRITELYKNNENPTAEDIRNSVGLLSKKEKENNIEVNKNNTISLVDEFVRDQGPSCSWEPGTYQKFRVMRSHIDEFGKMLNIDGITTKDIDAYSQFLLSIGLNNRTIKKHVGYLKWFLRWCYSQGFPVDQKVIAYRCRLKVPESDPTFLLWDELMSIWNAKLDNSVLPGLSATRDVFCFCAFSSLRYSDAFSLRWENISNDEITITTKKTTDRLVINLNKYTREILERYKGCEYPLPVVSNQVYNRNLKELAKRLGLTRSISKISIKGNVREVTTKRLCDIISSHDARRTFICNSLMLGIPANVVMEWTGHSDYKAMKPYIAIADAAKKKAMSLFDEKSPI